MAEIEVIEEVPMTLSEVKDKLESIKKDKELGFRSQRTLDYLGSFVTKKKKDVESLRKRLEELNITRLKNTHITKLIDIHPKDQESIKALFANEAITLKTEEVQKIIECLK